MKVIQNIKCNLFIALILLFILVSCIYILFKCNLLAFCGKWFYYCSTITIIGLVVDVVLCLILLKKQT